MDEPTTLWAEPIPSIIGMLLVCIRDEGRGGVCACEAAVAPPPPFEEKAADPEPHEALSKSAQPDMFWVACDDLFDGQFHKPNQCGMQCKFNCSDECGMCRSAGRFKKLKSQTKDTPGWYPSINPTTPPPSDTRPVWATCSSPCFKRFPVGMM